MSEASSDFRLQPRPAAQPRGIRAAPRSARVNEGEDVDPRLDAALSLDNPVFPLDPPIVDVRIPVKEPHAAATAYSRNALRHQFPDAQVGDDLHMLFSEPGRQDQSRLSPDVFVALNVPRRATRADYDADVLGPPDFVLEAVSRSTWQHDLGRKLDCYQRIGVRECLFFDVTGEDRARAGKQLWGYALTPEHRAPLKEVALPNGKRGVRSEVLGLVAYVAERVAPSGPRETLALTMRWHDPATGADIPDYDQARARTDAAEREAKAERERADAAAQEAWAERDRADVAEHEARAERDRADVAEHEARTERDRANMAEHDAQAFRRRIAELEERLRRRDEP